MNLLETYAHALSIYSRSTIGCSIIWFILIFILRNLKLRKWSRKCSHLQLNLAHVKRYNCWCLSTHQSITRYFARKRAHNIKFNAVLKHWRVRKICWFKEFLTTLNNVVYIHRSFCILSVYAIPIHSIYVYLLDTFCSNFNQIN